MDFRPVHYLWLAREFASHTSQCADEGHRSAISRAYYGAFLEARARSGIQDTGGQVHQKVIEHYRAKGRSAISNRLDSLRLKRNSADYDLNAKFSRSDANTCLSAAKRILEDLGVSCEKSQQVEKGDFDPLSA